ncbi:AcrR family transcriptional regulator [Collimonas sp. PA-H2]|uniref:TetR/AcrR family transcriptional regulator n=1 Tax=Collimonas sp. PA-H2 TaxID=1881062 RepID=UPI000BF4C4F8|nr:TetR/AcrR family transcriptional regulator [Collimonas sp. PA-H2]PFH12458.1 AcrR family transcriptional regulator [Collimonas sp. PA-H2]
MARYAPGHKEESRARIVDAAGRGFRKQGYGGIGVDGLAREAGVTHGAFYGHFSSKSDAFEAAIVAGLEQLRGGIEILRAEHGAGWLPAFVAFYLGYKRTCELGDACTLPSLSPEVERAGASARSAYQVALLGVVEALAAGLAGGTDAERHARAWALLAMLAGGVTMARAIPEPAVAEKIAATIQAAAIRIANGDDSA